MLENSSQLSISNIPINKKGKRFWFPFYLAFYFISWVCNLKCSFFPAGDVLLLFCIVGLILFIRRKWNDKAVLITAIIFLLQPIEWYHYITSLVTPNDVLPKLGVGIMYTKVADYTKGDNFGEFILGNIGLGQKASLLWAIGARRFLQTAGLFLLGILIGRKQLFIHSEYNSRFRLKALIISTIAFGPLYQLKVILTDNHPAPILQQTVGITSDMWQKFAFTIVLFASFVLLYQNEKFKQLTSNLRFYGKMSLTNYISQSIAGAILYFPFGFYLALYCGYTISLPIGILFFYLQVRFYKW